MRRGSRRGARSGRVVGVALAALAGCATETDPSSEQESPRDRLAEELGAVVCRGAASCCASFGHARPGEACHTAMRNAFMIAVIEAEDEGRSLVAGEVEVCLRSFTDAIDDATSCDELPAPAQLVRRCPTVFTEPEAVAQAERGAPCPHDEHTCGYPDRSDDCAGGDCWVLVFENVCR